MIQESTSDLSLIPPTLCSLRVIDVEPMLGAYEVANESITSSHLSSSHSEGLELFNLMNRAVFEPNTKTTKVSVRLARQG